MHLLVKDIAVDCEQFILKCDVDLVKLAFSLSRLGLIFYIINYLFIFD